MLPPPWSQAAPGILAGSATVADPTDNYAGRPDEELPLSPSDPGPAPPPRVEARAGPAALNVSRESHVTTSNINSIIDGVK
ncbi:hypothetical protein GCM10010466_45610 [Planomonospora alba]|uniref:Uncharacterized protein n=1 Tax=Planomonospora alba TaxID=161354 RepID=A0ABP6NIL7_9ACTN